MRQSLRSIALVCVGLVVGLFGGRTISRPSLPAPSPPAVDAGLDRLATVNFQETPFVEVVQELHRQTGANILVQWTSLEYEGIDMAMPVSLQLKDLPVRVVLQQVLEQVGAIPVKEMDRLDPVKITFVERDGLIVVALPEDFEPLPVLRIYDVSGLVEQQKKWHQEKWLNEGRPNYPDGAGDNRTNELGVIFDGRGFGELSSDEILDELILHIAEQVAPETWRDVGGSIGQIRPFGYKVLVVQTPEAHQQIVDLLQRLGKEE